MQLIDLIETYAYRRSKNAVSETERLNVTI